MPFGRVVNLYLPTTDFPSYTQHYFHRDTVYLIHFPCPLPLQSSPARHQIHAALQLYAEATFQQIVADPHSYDELE
jgi:hypothetical protein